MSHFSIFEQIITNMLESMVSSTSAMSMMGNLKFISTHDAHTYCFVMILLKSLIHKLKLESGEDKKTSSTLIKCEKIWQELLMSEGVNLSLRDQFEIASDDTPLMWDALLNAVDVPSRIAAIQSLLEKIEERKINFMSSQYNNQNILNILIKELFGTKGNVMREESFRKPTAKLLAHICTHGIKDPVVREKETNDLYLALSSTCLQCCKLIDLTSSDFNELFLYTDYPCVNMGVINWIYETLVSDRSRHFRKLSDIAKGCVCDFLI